MNQTKQLFILLIIILCGCAESVPLRTGPDIYIYPVTRTITLKNKEMESSGNILDEFISQHWRSIAEQGADITWFNEDGKKWSFRVKNKLLNKGVAENLINVYYKKENYEDIDLIFTVTNYITVSSSCEKDDFENLGVLDQGCTLEGLRWHSMVNPHVMLNNN